jgi:hypothetical protein
MKLHFMFTLRFMSGSFFKVIRHRFYHVLFRY